ncbi:hypothetical protein KBD45_00350 [Candidatus Dojkabacteria bacterium]|nr:hypothetical protein [Candidatus Dojkabacteria bacterium]
MKKFGENKIKMIGNALYATLFLFAFVLIGQNFVMLYNNDKSIEEIDVYEAQNNNTNSKPIPVNIAAETEVKGISIQSRTETGRVLGLNGCNWLPKDATGVTFQDTANQGWQANPDGDYNDPIIHQNPNLGGTSTRNVYFNPPKTFDEILVWDNECNGTCEPAPQNGQGTGKLYLNGALVYEKILPVMGDEDWDFIAPGGIVADRYEYTPATREGGVEDSGGYNFCVRPAPVAINGSCSTTLNSCNTGTLNDIADNDSTSPAKYLWNCDGSNGGTTANCSLDKAQCTGFNIYDNNNAWPNIISGSNVAGSKPTRNLSDTITIRGASNSTSRTDICWSADLLTTTEYLTDTSWKCENIGTNSGFVTKTLSEYINLIPSSAIKTKAQSNGLVFVTNIWDIPAGFCSTSPGYTGSRTHFPPGATRSGNGQPLSPRSDDHLCGSTSSSWCGRRVGINTATPIAGLCGGSAKTYLSTETAFTDSFCNAGTANPASPAFPAVGSSTTWTCNGSGGGANVSCTAIRNTSVVNGLCGGAAKTYLNTETAFTGSLCDAGTADPASPVFPAIGSSTTWTCNGLGGGTNLSCVALRNNTPSDGSCGLSHGKYFTSAPATDLCGTGTASGVTTTATGSWAWNCNGSDGGVNVSCTANLLVNVDAFSININYDEPKTIDFLDSKDYTFATNLIPEYIQSGAAYADTTENPNLNMDTNIGENPITSTQALCSGNSSCNIGPVNGTNRFGGATTCFTGDANMEKDIALGEPDNPITFWFEYEDKDNYLNPAPICRVNEFNSHKLALVPKGSYTATAIADNGDVLNRSTLYIEYNLSENKLETVATSAKGHDKVTITPIIKYDSQNKLRIAYKLKFGSNFPVGSYDLFSLVTSQINDPRKDYGGTLLYDNPIFPHSGKFNKVGEWTIDTIAPEVRQPYYSELGEDSFNINWGVRSNLELLDLNLGCYSNDLTRLTSAEASVLGYYNPLDFVAAFHSPLPGSFDNTFNTANRPECTPEGNTFLKNRVNTTLNTLQAMKSKHRIADPSEITNFVAKGRAVDKACNNIITSPIGTLPPTSENWISSEGGTFMSDTVSFDPQTSLFSKDHNLYCNYEGQASSNNQLLYSQVNDDILNLSTNSVFSTDNTVAPVERSLISAVAPDYSDTLDNELNRTSNTYFNVIEQKLNNYGLFNDVIIGDVSVDNVTDLFDCPDDKSCYIKIEGNLTINGSNGMDNKFGCTDKNMVLVTGNLTVIHNLTKSDPSMCCAFVVNGDIDFTKPISEAPKDETRFNSASEVDKQNWINTSQYDCGTGFFYSEGGDIIIQNDSTNYGIDVASENYADAFSLFGQLIARNGNIYQNRSNGLRNSLQPPVYIQQDSCIYKNFKAASEVFVNTRDITY